MNNKVFLVCVLWLSLYGVNAQDYRFPNPEFKTDYRLPQATQPPSGLADDRYLALAILILVMSLTAYFLYKRRSRNLLRSLAIVSLLYFGFYHGGCICSVGSIQNIVEGISHAYAPVPIPVIATFLLPLIAALFMGRIFCGAACPLGALQEIVIQRALPVPSLVDRCLKQLPYIYLGLATLFVICNMGYIICEYDPFVGLFRFSASLSLLCFGGVLLLLGMVIARPYCRYLCPYSVLLRLMSKLSPRKVKVCPTTCINCHLCQEACPVNAIQAPRPRKYPETNLQALTRLQWVFALSPAILAVGITVGSLLSGPLSHLQPEIRLWHQLDAGKINEEAVAAFLIQGGNREQLYQQATNAHQRLQICCSVFGAYLSIIFITAIVGASRRRTNENYTVDIAECVGCGRCYNWCPKQ